MQPVISRCSAFNNPEPPDVFCGLGSLIVEGRVPVNDDRGFGEGPHVPFPKGRHECAGENSVVSIWILAHIFVAMDIWLICKWVFIILDIATIQGFFIKMQEKSIYLLKMVKGESLNWGSKIVCERSSQMNWCLISMGNSTLLDENKL